MSGGDGVGGPCDFSVSPSPFGLDFGTLDSDFGLGLDNICSPILNFINYDLGVSKFMP